MVRFAVPALIVLLAASQRPSTYSSTSRSTVEASTSAAKERDAAETNRLVPAAAPVSATSPFQVTAPAPCVVTESDWFPLMPAAKDTSESFALVTMETAPPEIVTGAPNETARFEVIASPSSVATLDKVIPVSPARTCPKFASPRNTAGPGIVKPELALMLSANSTMPVVPVVSSAGPVPEPRLLAALPSPTAPVTSTVPEPALTSRSWAPPRLASCTLPAPVSVLMEESPESARAANATFEFVVESAPLSSVLPAVCDIPGGNASASPPSPRTRAAVFRKV